MLSLDKKTQEWQQEQEWLDDHIRRIKCTESLQDIFSGFSRKTDTFSVSMAYFMLTGREKIELYRLNNAYLVTIEHPHKEGTVLLYPELNGNGDLTVKVLNSLCASKTKVQLARYQHDDSHLLLEALERSDSSLIEGVKLISEGSMDWGKHYSHILDTQAVSTMEGRAYQDIRSNFRKAAAAPFQELPLINSDLSLNPQVISGIVESTAAWAQMKKDKCQDTGDDMQAFYKILVNQIEENPTFFDGFALQTEKGIVGFTIWDTLKGDTVNAIAGISGREIPGMSHYQMVLACQKLHAQDIKYYNLGGSEDDGLDKFKRGFRPIRSIAMNTYEPLCAPVNSRQSSDNVDFLKGVECRVVESSGKVIQSSLDSS